MISNETPSYFLIINYFSNSFLNNTFTIFHFPRNHSQKCHSPSSVFHVFWMSVENPQGVFNCSSVNGTFLYIFNILTCSSLTRLSWQLVIERFKAFVDGRTCLRSICILDKHFNQLVYQVILMIHDCACSKFSVNCLFLQLIESLNKFSCWALQEVSKLLDYACRVSSILSSAWMLVKLCLLGKIVYL